MGKRYRAKQPEINYLKVLWFYVSFKFIRQYYQTPNV